MSRIDQIYRYSPGFIKNIFSRSSLFFGRKPRIMPQPVTKRVFPQKAAASVIFSADFELAWAWRYAKEKEDPVKMALMKAGQTRKNFDFLLDLFNTRHLPVTWATIGHLFLESCNRGDHDWMNPMANFENKNWIYNDNNWFKDDPCNNYLESPAWYAPDLIAKILNSAVKHEIGCHTFSHIDMSDQNCSPAVADDEIKACMNIANRKGLKLVSFVFPGGTYGNYSILKKYGFKTYRKFNGYELFYPYKDEFGLVVLPSSLALGDNGLERPVNFYRKKIIRYIKKSIEFNTACNFWFHPSIDDYFLYRVLPPVLDEIVQFRSKGLISVLTMGEMADFILNNYL